MMPTPPRSGLSSRNSIDADEFPRKAGRVLNLSKRDNGLISPAQSSFSFADEIEPISMPPSNKPDLLDERQISGPLGRGSPGDAALMAMVNRDRASTEVSRRKSQYYSEVFAYREPNQTARERVNRYSVITAEVKTNVIVRNLPLVPSTGELGLTPVTGQRRIHLSTRSLPTSLSEISKTRLLHIHHSQPFRVLAVCGYFRLGLHHHHYRPSLPNTTRHQQTKRRYDTDVHVGSPRRDPRQGYCSLRGHIGRISGYQRQYCAGRD